MGDPGFVLICRLFLCQLFRGRSWVAYIRVCAAVRAWGVYTGSIRYALAHAVVAHAVVACVVVVCAMIVCLNRCLLRIFDDNHLVLVRGRYLA